jgi:hypothetical protein
MPVTVQPRPDLRSDRVVPGAGEAVARSPYTWMPPTESSSEVGRRLRSTPALEAQRWSAPRPFPVGGCPRSRQTVRPSPRSLACTSAVTVRWIVAASLLGGRGRFVAGWVSVAAGRSWEGGEVWVADGLETVGSSSSPPARRSTTTTATAIVTTTAAMIGILLRDSPGTAGPN